jgi:D-mannonate dehydratase
VYIGEQLNDLSDRKLTWAAQMGVEHLAVNSTRTTNIENEDGTWDVAAIKAVQARLATYGMTMDVLTLDLQSSFMTQHRFPGIMRGLPSRDAEIEIIKQNVRAASEAGVRLACHPHDPAVPHDTGLRGIHRVLGSVDGLKKFISIAPSKYHGLNFCVGTVAEMLTDPANQIYDVIRYFGERQKIFMVHLRNIKGGFLNFDEVYPDNGDMDFHRVLKLFKQVGYQSMFCPDHVPESTVDPDGEKQHSFCLGYTKAMIQAVNAGA